MFVVSITEISKQPCRLCRFCVCDACLHSRLVFVSLYRVWFLFDHQNTQMSSIILCILFVSPQPFTAAARRCNANGRRPHLNSFLSLAPVYLYRLWTLCARVKQYNYLQEPKTIQGPSPLNELTLRQPSRQNESCGVRKRAHTNDPAKLYRELMMIPSTIDFSLKFLFLAALGTHCYSLMKSRRACSACNR